MIFKILIIFLGLLFMILICYAAILDGVRREKSFREAMRRHEEKEE